MQFGLCWGENGLPANMEQNAKTLSIDDSKEKKKHQNAFPLQNRWLKLRKELSAFDTTNWTDFKTSASHFS